MKNNKIYTDNKIKTNIINTQTTINMKVKTKYDKVQNYFNCKSKKFLTKAPQNLQTLKVIFNHNN